MLRVHNVIEIPEYNYVPFEVDSPISQWSEPSMTMSMNGEAMSPGSCVSYPRSEYQQHGRMMHQCEAPYAYRPSFSDHPAPAEYRPSSWHIVSSPIGVSTPCFPAGGSMLTSYAIRPSIVVNVLPSVAVVVPSQVMQPVIPGTILMTETGSNSCYVGSPTYASPYHHVKDERDSSDVDTSGASTPRTSDDDSWSDSRERSALRRDENFHRTQVRRDCRRLERVCWEAQQFRRPRWNGASSTVGEVHEDGHVFVRKAPKGFKAHWSGAQLPPLCMLFEQELRSSSVFRYRVTIEEGAIGSADGIGFVFGEKIRRQNIQMMRSIFLNSNGNICQRRLNEVRKLPSRLLPMRVGTQIVLSMDLKRHVAIFEAKQTDGSYAKVRLCFADEDHPDSKFFDSGFLCAVVTKDVKLRLE